MGWCSWEDMVGWLGGGIRLNQNDGYICRSDVCAGRWPKGSCFTEWRDGSMEMACIAGAVSRVGGALPGDLPALARFTCPKIRG